MGGLTPSTSRPAITPPVPLTADHNVHRFSCRKPPLDDWLKYRAIKAEGRSARTYVACMGPTVVGYYCFAAGAVRIDEIPKKLTRNMPSIVPVTLLGRLAVDHGYQGLGIGKGLLKDALSRALQASKVIGSRAILVHAIDDAAGFYSGYGFEKFPEGSHTFFMPMETIVAAI